MKNAHINSSIAAVAPLGGLARVRRLFACALIGAAAMSAAHAGPGRGQQNQDINRDSEARVQRQYDERQPARQYDDRQRQYEEQRAMQARADEQRRQLEQQQASEGRRNGRMTPDERRDLRRQINEAGADIYPNNGRRR